MMFEPNLSERTRKELAGLVRRKGREETGLFLVEGFRSVEAAVQAGRIVRLIVSQSAASRSEVARLVETAGTDVLWALDHDAERISDVRTSQGVLGVAEIRRVAPIGIPADHPILVLDGIQDPGNVGTILRSAAWFGVRTAVAGPGTADWFGPKVVRASMGALWDLGLADTDDLTTAVASWRDEGRSVWIADMEGTRIQDWKAGPSAVLVLGSEAHGPSGGLRAMATGTVTIGASPGLKGTESLNVSAAAAVLLHAWLARTG